MTCELWNDLHRAFKKYLHQRWFMHVYICLEIEGHIVALLFRRRLKLLCLRSPGRGTHPVVALLLLLPQVNSCTNPWIYLHFSDSLFNHMKVRGAPTSSRASPVFLSSTINLSLSLCTELLTERCGDRRGQHGGLGATPLPRRVQSPRPGEGAESPTVARSGAMLSSRRSRQTVKRVEWERVVPVDAKGTGGLDPVCCSVGRVRRVSHCSFFWSPKKMKRRVGLSGELAVVPIGAWSF